MLQIPVPEDTRHSPRPLRVHNAAFIQAAGTPAARCGLSPPSPRWPSSPPPSAFTTEYQTKFGTPSTDASRGYDSAQALLLAMKAAIAGGAKPPGEAGSTATAFRTAVIAALARTIFTGADGQIAFAPNGDLQQGPVEVDQLGTVAGAPVGRRAPSSRSSRPTPAATLTPPALDFGPGSRPGAAPN